MKKTFLTLLISLFGLQLAQAKVVTEATLKHPNGDVEKLRSDDDDLLEDKPKFKGLSLSPSNWYCKSRSNSDAVLGRQVEKQFELDFFVKSLVNRKRLTRNQMNEVRRTPDCKPFRFYLHVIAKIQEEGYRLTKVAEIEE